MSDRLEDLDDYALADCLTNPLGTASMPLPNRPFARAMSVPQAKATQERCREELASRGYSDDDIELLQKRDYAPIQRRQAE